MRSFILTTTIVATLLCGLPHGVASSVHAAEFGHKGGPDIANIEQINDVLRQDPYDLELLISFGTSKGGSAGHLALAIRDQAEGGRDDLVYSANFYADRAPAHARGYYVDDLMCLIPKAEYLFKTTSSLGSDASFGLDMGEIFKRSVIGIRIYSVSQSVKDGLTTFLNRLNADFRAQKNKTEYHKGPIVYDYMNLNCAKTIGLAFKHGAGFDELKLKGDAWGAGLLPKALTANLPTDIAMKVIAAGAQRGYGFDVVLYKKWEGSTYVNPQDEGSTMYRDLPNRFPSILSLDYRQDQGNYEDYDNLFAMYLLFYLGKYSVVLDSSTRLLNIEAHKEPDTYDVAIHRADESATSDKKHALRRILFRSWGVKFGSEVDNTHLYDFSDLHRTSDGPADR